MIETFETIAEGGVIRLPETAPPSAHCLVTILDNDLETLRAQSQLELPEHKQRRMSELLLKNREGTLTTDESSELDRLSEDFDTATLTKGRAMAVLAQRNGNPPQD